MSGLVLPGHAPKITRMAVVNGLMSVPALTRFLDTPGLLAVACLNARHCGEGERVGVLTKAAQTSHRDLAVSHGIPSLAVLRRMTGRALSPSWLGRLKRLFRDGSDLRFLRHAHFVSPTLIVCLSRPELRRHYSNRFLAEIGQTPGVDRPPWRDVRCLGEFLSDLLPNTKVQSLGHYHGLWDHYHRSICRHGLAVRQENEFPEPPWEDEAGYAVALRTQVELIGESIAMQNCASTSEELLEEIERGTGYFFRVERNWGMPRATLYCVKKDGIWRIDQVKQRRNRPVPRSIVRCLALWIAQKQGIEDEQKCMPNTKTPSSAAAQRGPRSAPPAKHATR